MAVAIFILDLVVLPNVIVYGASMFASQGRESEQPALEITPIIEIATSTATRSNSEQAEVAQTNIGNPSAEQKIVATEETFDNYQSRVTSVVDGDIIKLDINRTIETIYLIGIDTSETVHSSQRVECIDIEAPSEVK